MHEQAGEIPLRARKSEWLVEALLKRDRPGDADRARRIADQTAEAADRHQIAGLADRVNVLAG